ncbi:uncharacterized protein LOC108905936 [Anoplophora glabripennis]|uniref:uncharacterized protein LOC108905936 n=1 Tax=Anoplophora glabripennis TaxID=217634 RepID=UPI00087534C1|nr:uncharacterized protein LOC108905936 [Anoplophora glabripennis]
MLEIAKWVFLFFGISLVALQSFGQQQNFVPQGTLEDARQGRNLLDWIGLGTGPGTDPYLAKVNADCLNGDLAECFKSRALASFEEFFDKPSYHLSENARIFRLPESQLRHLAQESFEYSEAPRADEPEWDQLVKFASRRIEKFLKSTSFELAFNDEVTERGRYSPRFIDDIVGEIDIIEDKTDSHFKRKQLKKLFIPLLLILKVFKLKLLLFLPLILGLASFKKLLGFLAIIIPGAIAFFNFCKPIIKQNGGNFYGGPHYSPANIGFQPYHRESSHYAQEYSDYPPHGPGVHFRDDNSAQNLAYNGWNQYRSSGKGIEAENTPKKSILPDS